MQLLRTRPRFLLAPAAVAIVTTVLTLGEPISAWQSNFMGGAPTRGDDENLGAIKLRFPAGVRSNWHTHEWGQLLMVEEGRALTQVRDEPIYEMLPGEPWWTGPDIEHWHGAAHDEHVLQITGYEGVVNWMDPVTDEEYRAPSRRR